VVEIFKGFHRQKFNKYFVIIKFLIIVRCQGMLIILKSKCSKWHDLGFDDGISKPMPLFTKLLDCLI